MKSRNVLSLASDFFNVVRYHNIQEIVKILFNNNIVEVQKCTTFLKKSIK
jgi:hypothetical protein